LITTDEYALAGGGVEVTNYYNTTVWLYRADLLDIVSVSLW